VRYGGTNNDRSAICWNVVLGRRRAPRIPLGKSEEREGRRTYLKAKSTHARQAGSFTALENSKKLW